MDYKTVFHILLSRRIRIKGLRLFFTLKSDHLILFPQRGRIKQPTLVKIKWKWLNIREKTRVRVIFDYESKGREFESRRAHSKETS